MPRMRTLKPGFFSNDLLAEVPPLGRLLFQGLWCLADREGRLEDRPKRIKAEILPYDACNLESLLKALEQRGFITRYTSGGVRYIQVSNFSKHQNPHQKEPPSTIPAPEEHSASTVLSPDLTDAPPGPAPDGNGASTGTAPEEPCSNFNSPNHGIHVQVQEQGSSARPKARATHGNPRVQSVVDCFRAATGAPEPHLNDRDCAAIKHSTAPPHLIAETFLAVKEGEWGDDFQKRRLSIHEACDWVNAYVQWREDNEVQPMIPQHDPSTFEMLPAENRTVGYWEVLDGVRTAV
jgi:hypothetical protein